MPNCNFEPEEFFRRCRICFPVTCMKILPRNTDRLPKRLQAFLADASGDEIQNVKEEWQQLARVLNDRSSERRRPRCIKLGSAWQPAIRAKLQPWTKFSREPSRVILVMDLQARSSVG